MTDTYKSANINENVEISEKFANINGGINSLDFLKQGSKGISGSVAEQIGNGLENNILNVKNYNKNIEPLAQCPTGQKLMSSAIKATNAISALNIQKIGLGKQ